MSIFKKITLPSRPREVLNSMKVISDALNYITFTNKKDLIETASFFGCLDKVLLSRKLTKIPEEFDAAVSLHSIIINGSFSIETRDQLITAGEVLVSTIHALGLEFEGPVRISKPDNCGELGIKLKDIDTSEKVTMLFGRYGNGALVVAYPEVEKEYCKHSIYSYRDDHNLKSYCFFSPKPHGTDLYDVSLTLMSETKRRKMPDGRIYAFTKSFTWPDNTNVGEPPVTSYSYSLKNESNEGIHLYVNVSDDTVVDPNALDQAFTTLKVNDSIFDNLAVIGKNCILTSNHVSMEIRKDTWTKDIAENKKTSVMEYLHIIKGCLTSCQMEEANGMLHIDQDGSWNWHNQGKDYKYSVESDADGKISDVSITAEKDGIDTSVGVKGVVDTATKAYQKTIGAMPSWIKRN